MGPHPQCGTTNECKTPGKYLVRAKIQLPLPYFKWNTASPADANENTQHETSGPWAYYCSKRENDQGRRYELHESNWLSGTDKCMKIYVLLSTVHGN